MEPKFSDAWRASMPSFIRTVPFETSRGHAIPNLSTPMLHLVVVDERDAMFSYVSLDHHTEVPHIMLSMIFPWMMWLSLCLINVQATALFCPLFSSFCSVIICFDGAECVMFSGEILQGCLGI